MTTEFQTTIYTAKKGATAWNVKASLLEAIQEAHENADNSEEFVIVPAETVRENLTQTVNCNTRSLKLQLARKLTGWDIRQGVDENGNKTDSILFRPKQA